jgi:hypothetical protein
MRQKSTISPTSQITPCRKVKEMTGNGILGAAIFTHTHTHTQLSKLRNTYSIFFQIHKYPEQNSAALLHILLGTFFAGYSGQRSAYTYNSTMRPAKALHPTKALCGGAVINFLLNSKFNPLKKQCYAKKNWRSEI